MTTTKRHDSTTDQDSAASQRTTTGVPSNRRWRLPAEPVVDIEADQLSSDTHARVLARLVREVLESASDRPEGHGAPNTIGLLSGFGTSKSTVSNFLKRHLAGDPNCEVVNLSVWTEASEDFPLALYRRVRLALEQRKSGRP